MIDWISSWANSVIIAVIIATIIEMILPNGNNKKYIKTVIGIFILFSIIAPVISKISDNDFDLKNIMDKYNIVDDYESHEVSSLNIDKSIEDVYIDNLTTDMKNKIKEKGYNVIDINVDIDMSEKNYGKINSIYIVLNKSLKENDISEIKSVNKIEINISEKKDENVIEEKLSSSEINELKEYLSQYYEVEIKNISIN